MMDHYSRRVMGFTIYRHAPTSVDVRACLGRTIQFAGVTPKHLVSDKGSQFWPAADYKKWCRRHGIKPRFGAVGQHGNLAVIERAIRTHKESLRLVVVPSQCQAMRRTSRRPRIEPRSRFPRGSPCAGPHALIAGTPGARFDLDVERLGGHTHLPIITLRRAA